VGVSKNTVSLALNNKTGVSDKRRTEILQAARTLHYGGLGIASDEERDSVLVLAPSYVVEDRQFYPEIIWEVEQAARNVGLSTVLTNVSEAMQANLTLPSTPYRKKSPRGHSSGGLTATLCSPPPGRQRSRHPCGYLRCRDAVPFCGDR